MFTPTESEDLMTFIILILLAFTFQKPYISSLAKIKLQSI